MATEVQVLPRDEAALSSQVHKQQVGIGIYEPVSRLDATTCQHVLTICRSCRRQWEQDHFLAIFTHATSNAYRNQGCRCGLCRLAATDHDTAVRYPERRSAAYHADRRDTVPSLPSGMDE